MASGRPTYAYRLLKEAETDFLEGLRYYAERDPDVARRFDQLIRSTVAIIVNSPHRWPIRDGSHRCILRRFPYTIAYVVDGPLISIVAIAHQKRDPASWEKRR